LSGPVNFFSLRIYYCHKGNWVECIFGDLWPKSHPDHWTCAW